MQIEQLISYIGTLGIGGFIGIFAKYYLDKQANHQKLLFEIRVRTYSGLMGRMFNLFNELDLNNLPEAVRVSKINNILSEVYLVGSNELVELIGQFKPKLFDFHNELDKWVKNKDAHNEDKGKELHKELMLMIGKIHEQMRKDLFIKSKMYTKEDLGE